MKLWTHSTNYAGQTYFDYYVLLGRHRDSDDLDNANFDAALVRLGGETDTQPQEHYNDPLLDDNGNPPAVIVARASHWAVGWSEFIGIHKTATDKIAIGEEIESDLGQYPVLDEDLYQTKQEESAQQTWDCLNYEERRDAVIKYGHLTKRVAGYLARRKQYADEAWEYLTTP